MFRRAFRRGKVATLVVGVPYGAFCLYDKVNGRRDLAVKHLPDARLPLVRVQHGSYDVAVVGGGIIGLATANEILRRFPDKTVAILEKESDVAAHQSGHNSGVIHAGMYYEPGTVMAKCCVDGAKMMYEYAEKKGIPHERVGKLICAPTVQDHAQVEELYRRGTANGVEGLRILTGEEVKEMEPNVDVYSALDSPNTGIIDYGDVTRSLAEDAKASGRSSVHLCYQVQSINVIENEGMSKIVEVSGVEPGQSGPEKVIHAKHVVTCAGLHMDHVGKLSGGDEFPPVTSFRGRYYQMKPEFRNIVKRNIYPVPSSSGLPVGIHFTPTIGGYRQQQMIIGPAPCLAFAKEGYSFWQMSPRYCWEAFTNPGFWNFAKANLSLSIGEIWKEANSDAFLADGKKLVPGLTRDMVENSFVGVMAQVFEEKGTPAQDYIFERKVRSGTTLNLRNAPSPGATSSMALARELVNMAEVDFGWAQG